MNWTTPRLTIWPYGAVTARSPRRALTPSSRKTTSTESPAARGSTRTPLEILDRELRRQADQLEAEAVHHDARDGPATQQLDDRQHRVGGAAEVRAARPRRRSGSGARPRAAASRTPCRRSAPARPGTARAPRRRAVMREDELKASAHDGEGLAERHHAGGLAGLDRPERRLVVRREAGGRWEDERAWASVGVVVVPADSVDEQAERRDRADHAERRQQNVTHERLPPVHHDLVTGAYRNQAGAAGGIVEVDDELALLTAGARGGAPGRGSAPPRRWRRRPARSPRRWSSPGEAANTCGRSTSPDTATRTSGSITNSGFSSKRARNRRRLASAVANGHAADLDRPVERMGDGAVRRHHEIAAELRLAPHHDPHRIAGGQHRLARSTGGSPAPTQAGPFRPPGRTRRERTGRA